MTVTPKAIEKIKEILINQEAPPAIRLGVQGGGCSGFSYAMKIENEKSPMDKEFEFDGLRILIDSVSYTYMQDVTVDYVEGLSESGFKFENPNVKSTCGCGSSFNV